MYNIHKGGEVVGYVRGEKRRVGLVHIKGPREEPVTLLAWLGYVLCGLIRKVQHDANLLRKPRRGVHWVKAL